MMQEFIQKYIGLKPQQIEKLFHCIGNVENWQHETTSLIMRYLDCNLEQAEHLLAISEFYCQGKESDIPNCITCPLDVYHLSKGWFVGLKHEELWVVYLDQNKHIIQSEQLTKGSASFTIVDPRQIFRRALLYQAQGLILIHNHPSGNCMPSKQDIEITQKVRSIGTLLHIPLVDHVIIGKSFASILHDV